MPWPTGGAPPRRAPAPRRVGGGGARASWSCPRRATGRAIVRCAESVASGRRREDRSHSKLRCSGRTGVAGVARLERPGRLRERRSTNESRDTTPTRNSHSRAVKRSVPFYTVPFYTVTLPFFTFWGQALLYNVKVYSHALLCEQGGAAGAAIAYPWTMRATRTHHHTQQTSNTHGLLIKSALVQPVRTLPATTRPTRPRAPDAPTPTPPAPAAASRPPAPPPLSTHARSCTLYS